MFAGPTSSLVTYYPEHVKRATANLSYDQRHNALIHDIT